MEKRLVTPWAGTSHHTSYSDLLEKKQLPYFLCQQREAPGDTSEGFLGWGGRGRGDVLSTFEPLNTAVSSKAPARIRGPEQPELPAEERNALLY